MEQTKKARQDADELKTYLAYKKKVNTLDM